MIDTISCISLRNSSKLKATQSHAYFQWDVAWCSVWKFQVIKNIDTRLHLILLQRLVLLRITSNYSVCSFCSGWRFSGVRGVGLRLVPVLRRFHVAGLLGLFGLSQAVLGPVGERGFPLPELDASLAKIRHEIRHRSDGHPRRDRFRQR